MPIPPKELADIDGNKTPWYTTVRRADKTAGFASNMRRTLLDLNVKRDTYSDEIENDQNQVYQLELELAVLRAMSEKLRLRIDRREESDREFQQTMRDAKLASKKLKKATSHLAGIANGVSPGNISLYRIDGADDTVAKPNDWDS